ncbi:hypothetical protein IF1G_06996 [Cordyceps javanica]|uniref:Uncharacterized protein n=1 Tax=Cordyceps javanica TaxID=43265 RepID=A0A545UXC3_9HYPO|nr:hypothetical protein IF1G_06996 [Cordyceps javanica]
MLNHIAKHHHHHHHHHHHPMSVRRPPHSLTDSLHTLYPGALSTRIHSTAQPTRVIAINNSDTPPRPILFVICLLCTALHLAAALPSTTE